MMFQRRRLSTTDSELNSFELIRELTGQLPKEQVTQSEELEELELTPEEIRGIVGGHRQGGRAQGGLVPCVWCQYGCC
ncbi:MAG: hypothetical protein KME46_10700 [Brasilonema angustatum HA4187-MV1]|jgi:hypothetical protein|nr:hypothetical protein [Brasilonema angustatum HA4187-MV1]